MKAASPFLKGQLILPLVQAPTVSAGIHVVEAMGKAGITCVEVVLRTPASIEALKEIKQAFPDMHVGAGTVLNENMLDQSLAAGADFIVTPAVSPSLLNAIVSAGVPAIPGTSKPSDILLAHEYGAKEMKLFPAELSGGVAFLKAVGAVFQDVKFCPTGGVNASNRKEYLALDNVFVVGGSWVAPNNWVEEENWQAITTACAEANSL